MKKYLIKRIFNWLDIKGPVKRTISKNVIEELAEKTTSIEGSEWDLIDSFDDEDFYEIGQICVSFHYWLTQFQKDGVLRTKTNINKIISKGYIMTDLGLYGWKHFVRL